MSASLEESALCSVCARQLTRRQARRCKYRDMSYVRKRALLACDFCRHRKRRCTGEQPCSTCVESNAECHYKELPVDRIESPSASNDAIAERLGRIESLLEDQAHQLQILAVNSQIASGDGLPVAVSSYGVSRASRARTGSPGEGGSHSPPSFGANVFPYDPAHARLSTSSSASSVPIVLVPPDHAHHVSQNIARQGSSGSLPLPLAALPPRSQPQPPPPLAGFVESVTAYDHATTDAFPSRSTGSTAATTQNPYAYNLTQQQQQQQQQQPAQGRHDEKEQFSFLIPLDHSTAANTLLSLPLVSYFLEKRHKHLFPTVYNEDDRTQPPAGTRPRRPSFVYARTYFFDIESTHPLPPLLDLERDMADLVGPSSVSAPPSGDLRLLWPSSTLRANLTAAYFSRVHPSAPLFGNVVFRQWDAAEERLWQDNHHTSGHAGLDSEIGDHDGQQTRAETPTIRTAICLAVWALGALVGGGDVHAGNVTNSQEARDQLAMMLFRPAFKILLHHALWELDRATLGIGQALLLAASFFSHIGRPLHNARLVYLANRHLLRLIEEQHGRRPDHDDDIVRVLWIGFILECDRAAELHVPRSGIEPLADHMPLPGSLDPHDANESDIMICFVAEIAMRRLLNRIHSSLYASSSPSSAPSFSSASSMPGMHSSKPPPMAATAATTVTSALDTAVGSGSSSIIPPGSKRKHRHDSESNSSRFYPLHPPLSLSSPLPPPPPTHTSITKMISISAELNRQLVDWYQTIPGALRPPLSDAEAVSAAQVGTASPPQMASSSSRDERVRILRIHYYAALHLIYRPFVLHVAWQRATGVSSTPSKDDEESKDSDHQTDSDGEHTDAMDFTKQNNNDDNDDNDDNNDKKHPHNASSLILDHCAVCVDACTAYLVHVMPLLTHRSPYLWSLCQGSMACLLVLLVADACPEIVSRRRQRKLRRQQRQYGKEKANAASLDLGWLCDQVAGQLRRWATPGSSFAAELAIIEQLPVRRGGPTQNAKQSIKRSGPG